MNDILYMGTTDFSAYILEELIKNNFSIKYVITQPDRKVGRKQILTATSVKIIAKKYAIECFDFENINDNYDFISKLSFSILVTCAYGQKISKEILSLSSFLPINIHASLLPKYRGGAPIHYAIINGDKTTGNTIMVMEEGLDSGDIISQSKVVISENDTTTSLSNKLMIDAAKLIIDTLPKIFENKLDKYAQNASLVSYSYNIKRSFELINFNREVLTVYNHMRALMNKPGCYAYINDKKVKFILFDYCNYNHNEIVSSIQFIDKECFVIYCINGYIKIYEFQIEGKKNIKVKDYLNGNKLDIVNNLIVNKGVSYEY